MSCRSHCLAGSATRLVRYGLSAGSTAPLVKRQDALSRDVSCGGNPTGNCHCRRPCQEDDRMTCVGQFIAAPAIAAHLRRAVLSDLLAAGRRWSDLINPLRDVVVCSDVLEREPERWKARIAAAGELVA